MTLVGLTCPWLSGFAVLLGAELDSEIGHQTKRGRTTGEHRPTGAREGLTG